MRGLINFMDRLTSRTVIQTDATIIAGLLILLTLQSLSTVPLLEKVQTLEEHIQEKNIELEKLLATKNKLISDLNNIQDGDRKKFFQQQIDQITVESYLVEEEIQGLTVAGNDWVDRTKENGMVESIMSTRAAVLLMVAPFAVSAMTEIFPSKKEIQHEKLENNEKATNLGKITLCVGFGSLIAGLAFIFSQVIF